MIPGGHNFRRSEKMLLGVKCCDVKAEQRSLLFFVLKQLFYLKGISLKVFNSLRGLFGQAERTSHFVRIKAIFILCFTPAVGPLQ